MSGSGRPDAAETTIKAYPDGPLLVRGPIALLDEDGIPVQRRRRTIALCRCGGSRIKPFCDGTHKLNGFRSEASETSTPALGADP